MFLFLRSLYHDFQKRSSSMLQSLLMEKKPLSAVILYLCAKWAMTIVFPLLPCLLLLLFLWDCDCCFCWWHRRIQKPCGRRNERTTADPLPLSTAGRRTGRSGGALTVDISNVFKQTLFGCYLVKYEETTSHSICKYIDTIIYTSTASISVGIPHKWTLFQLGDLFWFANTHYVMVSIPFV